MGWKSTEYLKRSRAIELIISRLYVANNDQLADALESLGYGDDSDLILYGNNFIVQNDE